MRYETRRALGLLLIALAIGSCVVQAVRAPLPEPASQAQALGRAIGPLCCNGGLLIAAVLLIRRPRQKQP